MAWNPESSNIDIERVKSPRKRAGDDCYMTPVKKRPRMSLPTPLPRVSAEGASSSTSKPIDLRERLITANPSNLFLSEEHVLPYLKATPRTIRTFHHYGMLAPAYESGGHWFDYSLTDHFRSVADHHMHGVARRKHLDPNSSLHHLAKWPRTVLDGPGLIDDFYANTLSWSRQDPQPVAVALGEQVLTYKHGSNPSTAEQPRVLYKSWGNTIRHPTTLEWAPPDGPQGVLAIGMREGTLLMKDYDTGRTVREWFDVNGSVNARALDWSGNTLACGYGDGSIQLFDVRSPPGSGIRRLKGPKGKTGTTSMAGGIGGVKWRRDGVLLASGGNDNLVNCWDMRMFTSKKEALHVWKHGGGVKALSWCPWQENILACGAGSADGRIYFRSTHSGETVGTIQLNHQITSLHFSQTCKEIVSLTGFRSPDRPIFSRDKRLQPFLTQTPTKQRRRASLAFITRPQSYARQDANVASAFESPTSTPDQPKIRPFCIVTHRYPSLEHVRTAPNWPFMRMTMGALSPDGTMLLTAGAEALSLRTIWGKSKGIGETDHEPGDVDVIR
ncbi:ubiquitin-protein transferase activating protein [Tulasnella sp. 330]|nr:ubiquitin-protein transferase activating protein [Tulasnella sp. 330]